MLKLIRIRSCSQCKRPLPDKCSNCLKHPEAKPEVIELFDFPKPVKMHSCGEHADFKCQGCGTVFMRYLKQRAKEKMTPFKGLFCTSACAITFDNKNSKIAIKVPCAYCGVEIDRTLRKLSHSKLQLAFCDPEHWYLYRVSESHKEKEKENPTEALLQCLNGCKDITEHSRLSIGLYKCVPCGKTRKVPE